MTRSVRAMFIVIIAALAVGLVQLRAHNAALSQSISAGGGK